MVPRGGHQTGDIEGLALVEAGPDAGVVISSSQAPAGEAAYFSIFDRATGSYLSSFRIGDGVDADGCSHTDGITATAADLGPAFPHVIVCQYDRNTTPGSKRNSGLQARQPREGARDREKLSRRWPEPGPACRI